MSYLCNGWNWIHLAGGIIGTWTLSLILFHLPFYTSGTITIIVDIVKELIDQFYKHHQDVEWLGLIGFDKAGGDWRDVGMCLLGIAISITLYLLGCL